MKTNNYINMPLALVLIALIIGGVSCKSKKKVADISDPNENKTEMSDNTAEKEMEPQEEEKKEEPVSKKVTTENKLSSYFAAIANAPSVPSANNSIEEALNLFDSPNALVLIVISESNGKKDYDRPTTIKEYLNYLKDQKKNINGIDSFKLDEAGKITELELTKK